MYIQHPFSVDISVPVTPALAGFELVSGEKNSHVIEITVTNAGVPVSMEAATTVLDVVRLDGTTAAAEMTATENVVSVALPIEAGAIPGRIRIKVFVTQDGADLVILDKYTTVRDGITGTVVDPGTAIPSLGDIIAEFAAMEAATADATAATTAANTATASANTAAGNANTQATAANTATSSANTAATNANTAAANVGASIAPAYSAASTYALGAICTYLGARYKCTTAITVAEAWTAGHWAEEPVQTVLDDHDSQLADIALVLSTADYRVDVTGLPPTFSQNGETITITFATGSMLYSYDTSGSELKHISVSELSSSLGSNYMLIWNLDDNELVAQLGTTSRNARNIILLASHSWRVEAGYLRPFYERWVTNTALTTKAARASAPTSGHIATLDGSGNPTDSGTALSTVNSQIVNNTTRISAIDGQIISGEVTAVGLRNTYVNAATNGIITYGGNAESSYFPVFAGHHYKWHATGSDRFVVAFFTNVPVTGAVSYNASSSLINNNVEFDAPITGYCYIYYNSTANNDVYASFCGEIIDSVAVEIAEVVYNPLRFITTDIMSRQGNIDGTVDENTLAAIKYARANGFSHIRLSLCFTSDGVGVLSHDATVTIGETTYTIAGTLYSVISGALDALDDAVLLCKRLGMELDLELKFGLSTANMLSAWNIVATCGMAHHVLWTATDTTYQTYILSLQPDAKVGYICHLGTATINTAYALKTSLNYVRLDCFNTTHDPGAGYTDDYSDAVLQYAAEKGLEIKLGSAYSLAEMIEWYDKVQVLEVANVPFPYKQVTDYYLQ